MTEKTWKEFRKTGLLLIINQILHIFGWAICCEYSDTDNYDKAEVLRVYPARVKFRGFDSDSMGEAYRKVAEYMKANASELLDEVKE
jgi:uncharacterized protein YigE (DUF2233 family)